MSVKHNQTKKVQKKLFSNNFFKIITEKKTVKKHWFLLSITKQTAQKRGFRIMLLKHNQCKKTYTCPIKTVFSIKWYFFENVDSFKLLFTKTAFHLDVVSLKLSFSLKVVSLDLFVSRANKTEQKQCKNHIQIMLLFRWNVFSLCLFKISSLKLFWQ